MLRVDNFTDSANLSSIFQMMEAYDQCAKDNQESSAIFKSTIMFIALSILFCSCAGVIFAAKYTPEEGIKKEDGKETDKKIQPEKKNPDVKLADIAGNELAKEKIMTLIKMHRDPFLAKQAGLKPVPLLFSGPSGCGKTMLATACANEISGHFYAISGSALVTKWQGSGGETIHNLFRAARENAPAVIFIDEIDAFALSREEQVTQTAERQTMLALMTEMEGFKKNDGITVIAATNTASKLDAAILSRFSLIHFGEMSPTHRADLINSLLEKYTANKDIDRESLVRNTEGMSARTINQLFANANLAAFNRQSQQLSMSDLTKELDNLRVGGQAASKNPHRLNLRKVAIHEAGHAVIALQYPQAMSIEKITIEQCGNSGGHNAILPNSDDSNPSIKNLHALIRMYMGGKAAESILLGDTTIGVADDLQKATELAEKIVCLSGTTALGPRFFNLQGTSLSEKSRSHIDDAITAILSNAYKSVENELNNKRAQLEELVGELLTHKTVMADRARQIVEQGKDSNSTPRKTLP